MLKINGVEVSIFELQNHLYIQPILNVTETGDVEGEKKETRYQINSSILSY